MYQVFKIFCYQSLIQYLPVTYQDIATAVAAPNLPKNTRGGAAGGGVYIRPKSEVFQIAQYFSLGKNSGTIVLA